MTNLEYLRDSINAVLPNYTNKLQKIGGYGEYKIDVELANIENSVVLVSCIGNLEGDKRLVLLWRFALGTFPNNCGIVISGAAFVHCLLRGEGLGQALRTMKNEICVHSGYTVVQCTTLEGNDNQIHILQKDGFVEIYRFVNKRTGNTCIQWAKEL